MVRLDPDRPLSELLDESPEARAALETVGVDACCGGALSLRQAAEVRGEPLEALTSRVRDALAAHGVQVAAEKISGSDSVRATLARFPHLAAVYDRHGLMGCGGAAGPDERIDFFAAAHRVDLATLLRELNEAAEAAPPPPELATAGTPASATLYRRFLIAALFCTLTLGSSFGALNLLYIHLSLGPIPPPHNWAHAGFQVTGFVLMFLMGVAYHTVPRFFAGELAWLPAARASFWLVLGGVILRAYGQFGAILPGTMMAHQLGIGGIVFGIGCFGAVLGATYLRSRPKREPFHAFLLAGTLDWLLAAAFLVAGAVAARSDGDVAAAAHWNEPFYLAALLGGAMTWIQGMLLRTGPVFLGLPAPRRPLVWATLLLGQLGMILAVAGHAPVGLLLVAASVVTFVIAARVFAPRAREAHAGDAEFTRLVRMAFTGSLLFAALATLYALLPTPPALLYDGARHALALGFIALLIFAMAGRIVPIFGGTALVWPRLRLWGCYAIFAGMLLREMEVVAALGRTPWPLTVSGLSGIVAATGVILASASLLATMRAARKQLAAAERDEPVAISPDANVAALLRAHQEALAILIEAGFAPLANPIARRTIARAVTLRTACQMHGVDVDALVARIRAACPHERPPDLIPPGRLHRGAHA